HLPTLLPCPTRRSSDLAPLFWFPRDCPRGCIWPGPATSDEDSERFFGQSGAQRVHVIESAWLEPMRTCRLYAYRFPAAPFRPHRSEEHTSELQSRENVV